MKLSKIVAVAALLTLGMFQVGANQTNVVQSLGILLRGVQSGGPTTNRLVVTTGIAPILIDTRKIIQLLGTATANTFSNSARLVLITPLGGGQSVIQVRDRNNTVDVTGFFAHQQSSGLVSGTETTLRTGRSVNLDYSIQQFALKDDGVSPGLALHFNVSGFASEVAQAGLPGVSNLLLDASGSGDLNGNLLILSGLIEVQGGRLEVMPDNLPSA